MNEPNPSLTGDSAMLALEQQDLLAKSYSEPTRLQVETRRCGAALGVGIATALLIVGVVALQFLSWQGTRELHTIMEVVSTLLATIVAVLALVRFYSKKNSVYLFLATGFLGTALLDGYHAVVTSSLLNYLMPSPPDSLIPWSWNASRTFLALLMMLMWRASTWERKRGESAHIHEGLVYALVGVLTVASFLFFACFPLPRAYYPELFFGRPEEFVAATFFAIALCGFASTTILRIDSFDSWLVWSLVVGFVGQAIVMSRSFALFDLPFDLAHMLKIVGYMLVLIGLLIEVHRLFRQAEESRISLRERTEELRVLSVDQQDAIERNIETVQQLEVAHEQLQQACLTAEIATRSKSEFLANMSHEIRTPMTAILGFTEIVLENVSDPQNIDGLKTIQNNGQYLLGLINDILDLSKIESGQLEVERIECSPCHVLADVVSLMRVRADAKNLALEIQYDGPIPRAIQSDPTRLRQILINLTGNAIKFSEVGPIRLVARVLDAASNEPKLQFDIVDRGIGMTDEQSGKLFQPFVQADASTTRKFGGTGLGLAISKQLAGMLGGDITINSIPGEGSTFSLTVSIGPLEGTEMLDEPTACNIPIERAEKPTVEDVQLDCRVLVAEDGRDNQRLLTFILKKVGADVTIAENGQIAFDLAMQARDGGNPFDVILMDMQMPILDGYKATGKLREAGYSGPIVALTAHAMAEHRQQCQDAGCDDFASKPIDRKKLIAMINKYSSGETTVSKPQNSSDVLVSELAGDEDMLELIEMFVGEFPDRVAEIERAIDERDMAAVARLAHQLRGAAGGYGFPRITDAAQLLEASAMAGDELETVAQRVSALTDLCHRARATGVLSVTQ